LFSTLTITDDPFSCYSFSPSLSKMYCNPTRFESGLPSRFIDIHPQFREHPGEENYSSNPGPWSI
jgi:hypothetical protein